MPSSAAALVEDGVATGSSSRASRLRSGAQAALGGAAWLLLAVLWLWQFEGDHVPPAWAATIAGVAGGAVVFAAFCVVWVRWNRSIYRRRHKRRAPIVSEVQFERDALGRTVVVGDGGREASQLVVAVEAGTAVKHYSVA